MATYNGRDFLAEQLRSILSQDEHDWRLIISDDGSTDGTRSLAEEYATQDARIIVLPEHRSGGACANFLHALAASTAQYTMFADQDDVWFPQKISSTLSAMHALESEGIADMPLLVHSDVEVVNKALDLIAPSFMMYSKLDSHRDGFEKVLVQNIVTGCTMMINKKLRTLMLQASPTDMIMHDWWAALIAAAMGHIEFVPVPLMLYRQHGNNDIGAQAYTTKNKLSKLKVARKRTLVAMHQSRAFAGRYRGILSADKYAIACRFGSMSQHSAISNIGTHFRYGLWKYGIERKYAQLLTALTIHK